MTCAVFVSVVAEESHESLPGVSVRIYREVYDASPVPVTEGQTDAEGMCSFHGLEGRSFLVVAESRGRVRAMATADALSEEEGCETDLEPLTLELALGASLVCEVRQESGEVVPGAQVLAFEGGSVEGSEEAPVDYTIPLASATTGADGRASLEGLPPEGIVTLAVKADGWTEATIAVQAPARGAPTDGSPAATLSVARASCCRGRVLRVDGDPASGATVFAVQEPYWAMLANPAAAYDDPETWETEEILALQAIADPTGTYSIRRLRPGVAYRFLALDGKQLASRVAALVHAPPPGKEMELNLVLEPLREIRILLQGADDTGGVMAELHPLDDSKPPGPGWIDDEGAIVFAAHPGSYALEVSGDGVLAQKIPLRIDSEGPATLEVRLAGGCRVEGTLEDERGVPRPATEVLAVPTDVPDSEVVATTTTTDENGSFILAGLAPGAYLLSVRGGGVICEPVEIQAPAAGVHLRARRTGVIRFRLSLEGKATEEEPEVSLWDVATRENRSLKPTKEGDGEWAVSDVRPGHNTLVVRMPSGATGAFSVNLSPGQDLSLGELRLKPGTVLQGSVQDPEGRPVSDALVGPAWSPAATRTDSGGRFSLQNLPRGSVTLIVEASGFLRDAVDVAAGTEALIHLSRGGQIRGLVTGFAEAPSLVVRGRVLDDPVGLRQFEVRPDAEGHFTARIHPGRVQLEAFHGDVLKGTATAVVTEGATVEVVLSIE